MILKQIPNKCCLPPKYFGIPKRIPVRYEAKQSTKSIEIKKFLEEEYDEYIQFVDYALITSDENQLAGIYEIMAIEINGTFYVKIRINDSLIEINNIENNIEKIGIIIANEIIQNSRKNLI